MTKPWELMRAEMLDGLAHRYGKWPREVLEEDVSLLQVASIVSAGMPEQE